MKDRGEKIVHMAREVLRAEALEHTLPPRPALPLKLLCLTTLLAVLSGGGITEWYEQLRRPINRYERMELDALLFYTARAKGADESKLRRDVESKLAVNSFSELNEHEFRIARRYLQDRAE